VEFALVLPMLLVLLLGIADFGRAFQAGIALEAAGRNAAEIGALERLRNPPPTDSTQHDAYYAELHRIVAQVACEEMTSLPMPDDERAGPSCQHLSAIRVCVMDGIDPRCGVPISGMENPIAARCHDMDALPSPPWPSSSGGSVSSHSVEVAVCYQFSTLFNLNLALPLNAGLSLGDVFMERTRSFVVDCPPGLVDAC
jgi:hypothetical protein